MTTTARTTEATQVPMDPSRKTALVAGVFYLMTMVSIPTLALYGPVKSKDFIVGSGADTGALLGCFLEVVVALAGIGTAITLFPVVKRQNEGMALGFVATRTLEAGMIFTGVVSLLTLVTLRQDRAQRPEQMRPPSITIGESHVATYNWAFIARREPHAGHQRPLAGHLDVPVRPRTTCPSRDGTDRGPTAHHRRSR